MLVDVYDTSGQSRFQTQQENLDARKGPFVDLEKVNAFRMDEVYSQNNSVFPGPFRDNFVPGGEYPLVLCDVYARKRSGTNSKKTGTPILYSRARTQYSFQDATEDSDGSGDTDDDKDDIYNYYDNEQILELGMPDDGLKFTVMKSTSADRPIDKFEKMIVNENIQSIKRPYRADSYILLSAGKDGDFGTADDVFNFDKEVIE